MQAAEELTRLSPQKDMALTIGVFDGVHLGHKHLLSQLKETARPQNLLTGVVTFRQHPQEVLSSQTKLPCLTNLRQRITLLKNEGIDMVIPLSFTPELAHLSARQFASLLKQHLRMSWLVIGPDFALGQNRKGSANALRKLGREMDFGITVVPPIVLNGEVVSSTAIRQALANGNMEKVHHLIGRFFSLQGRVISGAGRGKELGFPTANLEINREQALPANGVYATRAYLDDQTYRSLTNIGQRPTFGAGERTVEVYLLDYHGDLYGHRLKINIIDRIRPEKRFDNAEQLKQQIGEDIERGQAILDSSGRN